MKKLLFTLTLTLSLLSQPYAQAQTLSAHDKKMYADFAEISSLYYCELRANRPNLTVDDALELTYYFLLNYKPLTRQLMNEVINKKHVRRFYVEQMDKAIYKNCTKL